MFCYYNGIRSNKDLSDIEDDDALFEELEREEDTEIAHMRERRIREIQQE